ncbi:MAG: hypothetical protein N3A58_01030 [Spirochaetes bacterium]|nr:hypothetical protein [Spirochaetota bacterium]
MKGIPQYKKIEENMKPGKFSIVGFLGNDKRTLFDIISEDISLLNQLEISVEKIVSKLKYFREKGFEFDGLEVEVDKKWIVSVNSTRGKTKCPFEDKGFFPKTEIKLKYLPENIEINYTDLSIHLIEKHNFFGGKGSIYRLEPEILKKVLEI